MIYEGNVGSDTAGAPETRTGGAKCVALPKGWWHFSGYLLLDPFGSSLAPS